MPIYSDQNVANFFPVELYSKRTAHVHRNTKKTNKKKHTAGTCL